MAINQQPAPELIIEQVGRSGLVLNRQRISEFPVSLGRAYNNRVVLDDPYVDAYHASIYWGSDGRLYLRDLASKNGTEQAGRLLEAEAEPLALGQVINLGKSHLRILDVHAPVPEALPISLLESCFQTLARPWFVLIGLLLLTALVVLQSWMSSSGKFALQNHVAEMVAVAAVVLAYGGVWALVGRVIRHDSRFLGHCMVVILVLLLLDLGSLLLSWGSFNLGALWLQPYLEAGLLAVMVFLLLRVSYFLATHLSRWRLTLMAGFLPLVILLVPVVAELTAKNRFSTLPDYPAQLLAPQLQLMQGVSQQAFIDEAGELFDQVQSEPLKP